MPLSAADEWRIVCARAPRDFVDARGRAANTKHDNANNSNQRPTHTTNPLRASYLCLYTYLRYAPIQCGHCINCIDLNSLLFVQIKLFVNYIIWRNRMCDVCAARVLCVWCYKCYLFGVTRRPTTQILSTTHTACWNKFYWRVYLVAYSANIA